VRVRSLVLALAVLVLAGCAGGDDAAAPDVVSIVQDDAELLHRSPARIAATLNDLRGAGVDWVRVTAGWSIIAPHSASRAKPGFDATDPGAYPRGAWAALDRVATRERGMRLAVDIAF